MCSYQARYPPFLANEERRQHVCNDTIWSNSLVKVIVGKTRIKDDVPSDMRDRIRERDLEWLACMG